MLQSNAYPLVYCFVDYEGPGYAASALGCLQGELDVSIPSSLSHSVLKFITVYDLLYIFYEVDYEGCERAHLQHCSDCCSDNIVKDENNTHICVCVNYNYFHVFLAF